MKRKDETIALNELRDQSAAEAQTTRFGKSTFGGYSKKQVDEYIGTLKEELENAEASFNSRLEEYAAMTEMLRQERDQYGEALNVCEASKSDLEVRIRHFQNENEELKRVISSNVGLNQNQSEFEVENEILKKKLNAYEAYEGEYGNLKDQLNDLKTLVKELNAEVKSYAEEDFAMPVEDNNQDREQIAELEEKITEMVREKNEILEEKGELTVTLERIKDENDRLKKEIRDIRESQQKEIDKYQLKLQNYREIHQQKNEEMMAHLELALEKLKIDQNNMDDSKENAKPDNDIFKDLPFNDNSMQDQLL